MTDGVTEPASMQGINVLRYSLACGPWICVRPSGTEPKLKLYIGANASDEAGVDALLQTLATAADRLLTKLLRLN